MEAITHKERILRYFSNQILGIFKPSDAVAADVASSRNGPLLKKRWRVAATAVVYFRKFYGSNELQHYDPRLILLSSIFLAGKTEENIVTFTELFSIHNKYSEKDVLKAEVTLLESLQFDLKIHHPHNCINAVIADFKLFCFNQLHGSNEDDTTTSTNAEATVGVSETVKSTKLFSALGSKWLKRSDLVLHSLQLTSAVVEYTALVLALVALQMSFDLNDDTNNDDDTTPNTTTTTTTTTNNNKEDEENNVPLVEKAPSLWPVSFETYLQGRFSEGEGTVNTNGVELTEGVEAYNVLRDQMQQVKRRFYSPIERRSIEHKGSVVERVAFIEDSIRGDDVTASFRHLKNTTECIWAKKPAME